MRRITLELSDEHYFFLKEKALELQKSNRRASVALIIRELIEKDFFGTNGVDLNTMNFIDRCNLHFKGGANFNIKFTDKENKLVNLIDGTKSYDDVIVVTKKVMAYLKEEKEERKKKFSLPDLKEEESEEEEYGEVGYGDDVADEFLDELDVSNRHK